MKPSKSGDEELGTSKHLNPEIPDKIAKEGEGNTKKEKKLKKEGSEHKEKKSREVGSDFTLITPEKKENGHDGNDSPPNHPTERRNSDQYKTGTVDTPKERKNSELSSIKSERKIAERRGSLNSEEFKPSTPKITKPIKDQPISEAEEAISDDKDDADGAEESESSIVMRDRLEKLKKDEEKLKAQKYQLRKEKISIQKEKEALLKTITKRGSGSFSLEQYPDSGKESATEEFNSEDESDDITGDGDRSDEALSAKDKFKKEKERLKKQEELLRKSEKLLHRKAEEDLRVNKDILRKEKERLKKEKEKARMDAKKESQRLRRLSYDVTNKNVGDMMSGWVKMRGPLKNWHLRYFVLRPGRLIYYRDEVAKDCQGIVLLNGCEVSERKSKKEGSCFKIYHPKEANIYSLKGLKGETLPSGLVPLSADHCILRVSTESERTKWIDALLLSIDMTCSSGLERTESGGDKEDEKEDEDEDESVEPIRQSRLSIESDSISVSKDSLNKSTEAPIKKIKKKKEIKETLYIPEIKPVEDDSLIEGATEEKIGEESKGLVLMLLKQVRPGMDLSRVVLPTFILEPRSMLEKVSDYLTHCELLASVPSINDPKQRFIALLKWYLSGYYIKPRGVKKPYNPILGETFRCIWNHPDSSRTLFVSEQVSHHPPISAFYASNRKAGFIVNGSILFRSKFTGTAAGSILDGFATVSILPFDEEYEITFPSAYAKGFLLGTLMMELVGAVTVQCAKTGYRAEIEFKQKPLFGGDYNVIAAKIKHEKDTLFTLTGKWDGKIEIKDTDSKEGTLLWYASPEVRREKIPKCKPPLEAMEPFESDRLWNKVSEAIHKGDQQAATDEKANLEQAQREAAKMRIERGVDWKPKLFFKNRDNIWTYKYLNKIPWDKENEIEEVEVNGVIRSKKVDDSSSSASEDEEKDEILLRLSPKMSPASKFQGSPKPTKRQLTSSSKSQSAAPSEAWEKKLDERLLRIEKDILVLHHKKEPPKQSINKWIVVALVVAILVQMLWR